ncbi:MAG: hypothetical protein IT508_10960 [Burkholderiaceae bacterium]|nr:hypothetical protein [Burkholderiaceae bacterium]
MANVYGVTHTTIREEFFPAAAPFNATTRPTDTTATRIISRVSASLDAALLAVGVTSADIDAVGEPVSYAWLADTLSLGVAARLAGVGALGVEADAVKRWASEFDARLRSISDNADGVIPDAVPTGASGSIRSHVATYGLADDDAADMPTTNGPLFTVNDEA